MYTSIYTIIYIYIYIEVETIREEKQFVNADASLIGFYWRSS